MFKEANYLKWTNEKRLTIKLSKNCDGIPVLLWLYD